MAAKTKIAKNEQMAASLSSENSKLECEVQIGAHKERISVLEAELTAVKHSHPLCRQIRSLGPLSKGNM